MSRGPTLTSALTRCKAASQSSRRRKTSRRVLKPCKGAQNNVLERERWYSRKAALSCVALHVLPSRLATQDFLIGAAGIALFYRLQRFAVRYEFFSETRRTAGSNLPHTYSGR